MEYGFGQNRNSSYNIKRGIYFVFIYYILLTALFYIIQPQYIPRGVVVFIQLFLNISLVCGIYVGMRLKGEQYVFLIFIYQFFSSILLRQLFMEYYNNPFGYDPMDSVFYHEEACRLKDYTINEVFHYFRSNDIDADDWGGVLIQRFVYLVGDTENGGLIMALFFNSFIVAFSSLLVYKFSCLFFNNSFPLFFAILWGFSPVAVRVSAIGTKENYFLLFIIGAIYYTYKFWTLKCLKYFLCFTFWCAGIFFFRYALCFMMLLSFVLAGLCYNRVLRKWIPTLIIVCLGIGVISFYFIIEYIGNLFGKEWISTALEYQLSQSSQGVFVTMLTNVLGGIIGPFPNFIGSEERTHTFIYILVPLMKLCFSYFFLFGIYFIIKQRKYEYYPLLLFLVLNTFMIIITYFSLVVRYSLPHYPMLMIISAFGYMEYKKLNFKTYYYHIFLVGITFLIWVFNFRQN